ncbi:TPA: restriction endonuclease subunit S [Streptococcus agalactiae]
MPQNPTSNPEKKTYLLSELVDCFKGKAVPSKAEAGDIRIINLSDMSPLGIDYHNLRTFQDEQRSLLKYLLQEGDVLIASKGTVKKVAIFEEQDYPVVASANITILSIPLFRQDYLIQRYKQGLNDYKRKIARAEQEWERIQNDIRQQLS